MRRSKFVRFQIGILILLVLGFFVYMMEDGNAPEGSIVQASGFDGEELWHRAFSTERGITVAIEATGSFENESSLAVYGWMIRRDDQTLVWAMRPDNVEQGRNMRAQIQSEVRLAAGMYDVYFTTYGDPLAPQAEDDSFVGRISEAISGEARRWKADMEDWAISVAAINREDRQAVRSITSRLPTQAEETTTLIWQSGAMRNRSEKEHYVSVERPVHVQIYAIGDLYEGQNDYGFIENIGSGERVWEMTAENTKPAGGSIRNRVFDDTILLGAGQYRFAYQTDRRHSFRSWTANPPFDPIGWGMRVHVANESGASAITPFDAWASLPQFVAIHRVQNDQLRSATFRVEAPSRIMVYALGEITSDSAYDYAWLTSNTSNRKIWEMKRGNTTHAGGTSKNREAITYLDLEPGDYTVYYQTDGSYAFHDFDDDGPPHPERWGVTLFAFNANQLPEITDVDDRTRLEGEEANIEQDPSALVRMVRIGNNITRTANFELTEETTLRVYAQGEIIRENRYDYGWITNAATGQVVWEMTDENTVGAGGASKNKMFYNTITLPAGEYTAHYQTDGSHAYGDFNEDPPNSPTGWGITILHVRDTQDQ